MWKYVVRRLLMLIPVLLGVILIVFVLNAITPGDPARAIAGELATEEDIEKLELRVGDIEDDFELISEKISGWLEEQITGK